MASKEERLCAAVVAKEKRVCLVVVNTFQLLLVHSLYLPHITLPTHIMIHGGTELYRKGHYCFCIKKTLATTKIVVQ